MAFRLWIQPESLPIVSARGAFAYFLRLKQGDCEDKREQKALISRLEVRLPRNDGHTEKVIEHHTCSML